MPGTGYFVLTLPLRTERWQEDVLRRSFEVHREIYNALLRGGLKRYRQMSQTKRYRRLIQELDGESDERARKAIYQQLDEMLAEYRLRKFDLSKDATQYRKYFKENTDAPMVQNLAAQVWKALYAFVSRQAKAVHFKKPGEIRVLEGKTNQTSVRYQDGLVLWKALRIPARVKDNAYEKEALTQEIRYCRIKRKWIKGRERYYVDLVLRGKCPVRGSGTEMDPGQNESEIASGSSGIEMDLKSSGTEMDPKSSAIEKVSVVGLDLELRRITAVSDTQIRIFYLPEKDRQLEQRRRELARKMERSRRVNHPHNYDARGRILPGEKVWNFSNHYLKYREMYRELGRLQKVYREERQRQLIRELQQLGDHFHVEKLEYQKMRRRTGNIRLGRAVEKTAVAGFLQKFQWKLEQAGKELIYFDPVKTAAARWNHVTGKKEAVSHKTAFRNIEGVLVEKHIYSAFLLQHGDAKTGEIQAEECRRAFGSFWKRYESGEGFNEGDESGLLEEPEYAAG